MPSHNIPMKGQLVNMRGQRVGGAVALLLDATQKKPLHGGEISSNKIVGIITPQPARSTMEGGELLKHIHFGSHPNKHNNNNERIKFIF